MIQSQSQHARSHNIKMPLTHRPGTQTISWWFKLTISTEIINNLNTKYRLYITLTLLITFHDGYLNP